MTTTLETSVFDAREFLDEARRSRFLIVDIEGDGKDVRDRSSGAVTMGVTLSFRDQQFKKRSYYFPFFHIVGDNQIEYFEEVRDIIKTHPCLVMHNAKHDLIGLELWDIHRFNNFYDTMIMAHLINENQRSYQLDYLSRIHGGEPKAKSKLMEGIIDFLGWSHVPADMMQEYSIQDGFITLELFEKLYQEFCAQGLDGEFWHKTEQWIWTISQMEKMGIRIDADLCKREIAKGEFILKDKLTKLGGRNPLSAKDLYQLLVVDLNLPVVRRTKKGNSPSFDKKAMQIYEPMLKKIGSPVAEHILTYRGWNKVVSTNYKPYLKLQGKDGRIHPNYKMHSAVTRRLACGADSDGKTEVTSPNLQNIPRMSETPWNGNLKAAFIAEDGYTLWEIDQSQAEMRLGTAYSGDPKLLEIFLSGKDLFDGMAEDLGWARQNVKTFNYMTGYGAQDERIADEFGIPVSEAHDMRITFNNTYHRYVKCKGFVSNKAEKKLTIKYWSGAIRHFETSWDAKKKGWNSLIQGGIAELIKYQAVDCGQLIDWDTCRMLLQIHDSLVFEIKNGYEAKWIPSIIDIMQTTPEKLKQATLVEVPLHVDVKKWGTNEKWQMAA